MKTKYIKYFTVLLITLPAFFSCMGLNTDIQLNQNGSGRVSFEYSISASLSDIGLMDGNMDWPSVPIGDKDFERAINRLDGAKLVSYSSRKKGDDLYVNAVADFDNIETLLELLGDSASYADNCLTFELLDDYELEEFEEMDEAGKALLALIKTASKGKKITLDFAVSGKTSALTVTDANGKPLTSEDASSLQITGEGKKVSFSIDTDQIFDLYRGLVVTIKW